MRTTKVKVKKKKKKSQGSTEQERGIVIETGRK